jgi:hypothetical protein
MKPSHRLKPFLFVTFIVILLIILSQCKIIGYKYSNDENNKISTLIKTEKLQIDTALVEIKALKQLSESDIYNEFNKAFGEIFEKKSLEESINLIKTLKFMVKDVDEYDPELIEFVRTLIKPPSKLPLNLINKNAEDYSQLGQSSYMNTIFNSKRNGFFIESGAHDGESLSNSLYFEKKFNWTGLLIEPLANSFKELSTKNRNAYTLNACIAKKKPFVAKFRVVNVFSGRQDQMNVDQVNYIDNNVDKNTVIEYMPCFSLNTILHAINVKNVDMFSLDIEGGEWDVIESIDYSKYNINLFCIEWYHLKDNKQKIHNHLLKNGYKFVSEKEYDYFYQKV